jgi:ATPase family protein associated with various cellular activities (AAA)
MKGVNMETKPSDPSAGSRAAADIAALLRARNPLLWIVTREEARVERLLMDAAQAATYDVRFWDCATGISAFDGSPQELGAGATDPAQALNAIRDSRKRAVWVLRDLPAWLRDPTVARALRSLAKALPSAERDQARAVVVLTPSNEVPPELAGHAIVIDFPLPDRQEIAAILDAAIAALPDGVREAAAPNGTREAAIDAAVGLTAEEAQSCYAKSLVSTRRIDPATVATEKKRVIAREKVLEWYDPIPGGLDAVGGLDELKGWLNGRRAAFGPRARAYGLPAPKGCLLVGVPGCGKSLTAKAIATAWGMPLLRLDLGALKSKYVGDSEANIRKALRVAETVAPCVLWLDEIEKALAGATQGAADGGVSADSLGAVLSWMQDRAGSVFVVATANDVSALPPELLRKGRFDELFFVDLPTLPERTAILQAALKVHGRDGAAIALDQIAALAQDFTGAELAALVPDALFSAFADGEREINAADLIAAARATVPLARTASEKIDALRRWAKGRARPASTAETAAATRNAPKLDI